MTSRRRCYSLQTGRKPRAFEIVRAGIVARMEASAMQCTHEPLYDILPLTGLSIEVFYADRTLETFGRGGAGWFGGRADAALRRMARLSGRSLQATQRIGTRRTRWRSTLNEHERLANRTSLSMCQPCDMEEPTKDDTWLESPVFTSIF